MEKQEAISLAVTKVAEKVIFNKDEGIRLDGETSKKGAYRVEHFYLQFTFTCNFWTLGGVSDRHPISLIVAFGALLGSLVVVSRFHFALFVSLELPNLFSSPRAHPTPPVKCKGVH